MLIPAVSIDFDNGNTGERTNYSFVLKVFAFDNFKAADTTSVRIARLREEQSFLAAGNGQIPLFDRRLWECNAFDVEGGDGISTS